MEKAEYRCPLASSIISLGQDPVASHGWQLGALGVHAFGKIDLFN
jgi:hypothetical protein